MHLFRLPPGPLITTRRVIFAAGFAGFWILLLTVGPERPFYMAICVFMMGLPLLVGVDKKLLTTILDRPAPAEEESPKEPGP